MSLADIVRRTNPRMRRSGVALRVYTPTQVQADALSVIYMQVIRQWQTETRAILAAYARAIAPGLHDADPLVDFTISQADDETRRLIVSLIPRFTLWATAAEARHRRFWTANIRAALGVDVSTLIGPAGAQQSIADTVAWNTSLITNVSDTIRHQATTAVLNGLRDNTPVRDVGREIARVTDIQAARSRRIAIDQNTKLASALDTTRMAELDIPEWIWRHSGKLHPRAWHLSRNGRHFTAETQPAADDLPGIPPFCGCKKQPFVDLSFGGF